jgi:regulator of replication initiation timing
MATMDDIIKRLADLEKGRNEDKAEIENLKKETKRLTTENHRLRKERSEEPRTNNRHH